MPVAAREVGRIALLRDGLLAEEIALARDTGPVRWAQGRLEFATFDVLLELRVVEVNRAVVAVVGLEFQDRHQAVADVLGGHHAHLKTVQRVEAHAGTGLTGVVQARQRVHAPDALVGPPPALRVLFLAGAIEVRKAYRQTYRVVRELVHVGEAGATAFVLRARHESAI